MESSNRTLPFQLLSTEMGTHARACRFQTPHGEVLTPQFMPVGTQGAVRGQTVPTLLETQSRVLLANTYHLWIRPGLDVIRHFGGLHSFIGWNGPILTDSGGYQTFSLSSFHDLDEQGVSFTSHLDGIKRLLTPEISIEAQEAIGSDIMMVLDQCVASTSPLETARKAADTTHRWAERCLNARTRSDQALFAIVQGAAFSELRRESASVLSALPFDGYAIGGLAVGESRELRENITELTTSCLPVDRPRYLMGVGTPIDLLEAVHRGIDLFDCILPTALAQHGVGFTSNGKVDLRRGVYEKDKAPLDPNCSCSTCDKYSRAYLRHLTRSREILGWQLIGLHNLNFYHSLVAKMREAIIEKRFCTFYREHRETLTSVDREHPPAEVSTTNRRKDPETCGAYSLILGETGTYSLRHSSGEVIHSIIDAEFEAKTLYSDPSEFERRSKEAPGEIVVWDVGLGAAFNAMAAISSYEKIIEKNADARPLLVVSFENDMDALRLALRHAGRFPHVQHAAPRRLLDDGAWNGNGIRWRLVEGDFLHEMAEAPVPDLIYYDPYSFRTDTHLWTYRCFQKVFASCRTHPCQLFTYSASTAARAALLAAGFVVGKGPPSGPKNETTRACSRWESSRPLANLLDENWLQRWERSGAKYPADIDPSHHERFAHAVRNHLQFKKVCGLFLKSDEDKSTTNQPVDTVLS